MSERPYKRGQLIAVPNPDGPWDRIDTMTLETRDDRPGRIALRLDHVTEKGHERACVEFGMSEAMSLLQALQTAMGRTERDRAVRLADFPMFVAEDMEPGAALLLTPQTGHGCNHPLVERKGDSVVCALCGGVVAMIAKGML